MKSLIVRIKNETNYAVEKPSSFHLRLNIHGRRRPSVLCFETGVQMKLKQA